MQRRSRLQDRPTAGGVHKLGLRVAALLQRRLGADAALELVHAAVAAGRAPRSALFPRAPSSSSRRSSSDRLAAAASGSSAFKSSARRASSTPSARSARRSRCWRSASAMRARSPSRASNANHVGARGQRGRPCRHRLLGPAAASARLVERAARRLPPLGRRAPLRFGCARLHQTLVQEPRGGLRRQVRMSRRAALNERARFGLEVAHVPLDAGDAAHPVAMVFGVVEGPVPNLERCLGGFDRRVALETRGRRRRPPSGAANRRGGPRRRRLRFSLPRGAGALP